MDISDLEEMGLIDNESEFILGITNTPIVYSEDGANNINSGDFSSCSDKVTFVTVADIVPVQKLDGISQNINIIVGDNQSSTVDLPILLNEGGFITLPSCEEGGTDGARTGGDSLCEELSKYLTTPAILISPGDVKGGGEKNAAPPSLSGRRTLPALEKDDIQPPDRTGPMHCEKCDVQFSSWKLYKKHKIIHSHDKPYQCSRCSNSFNYELNLKLHEATHNVSDPVCPVCQRGFSRVASLKAHIMLHQREESLFCSECGDEFPSHLSLQNHLNEEHGIGKSTRTKPVITNKVYQCRLCLKVFNSANNCKIHQLKYHKISHSKLRKHNRKVKRSSYNTCEFCNKRFEKPSQLLRHKRIHTGEKPFKCDLCTKAFNQKNTLQIHMLKHTRERPYVCEQCGTSFSQKGNLQAHINRLHGVPEDNETIFKCPLCTCIFRKLGNLNSHLTKAHNDFNLLRLPSCDEPRTDDTSNKENENSAKEEEEEKRETGGKALPGLGPVVKQNTQVEELGVKRELKTFHCLDCSKVFLSWKEICRHINTSHNEKNTCKCCAKCFPTSKDYEDHCLTQLFCQTCGDSFCSSERLNEHEKKHRSAEIPAVDMESSAAPPRSRTSNLFYQDQVKGKNILVTERGNIVDLSPDPEETREESSISFKCRECGITCQNLDQLLNHGKTHFTDGSYKCMLCPCSFRSWTALKQHTRSHHCLAKPTCDVCSKEFTTEGGLQRHLECHIEEYPWVCPLCEWTFKSYLAARKHLSNVHPEVKKAKPLRVGGGESEETALPQTEAESPMMMSPEKTTIPVVVLNEMDDVISVAPSEVYLIADEDGTYRVVPVKSNQLEGLGSAGGGDLVLNSSHLSSTSLKLVDHQPPPPTDPCIFTIEPEAEINDLIASHIPASQPQLINNRSEIADFLSNILDSPLNKSADEEAGIDKIQSCHHCNKSFTSSVDLEEHLKEHEQKSQKANTTDNSGNLCDPSQSHSALFTCSTCSLNVLTLNDLICHQAGHEKNERNKTVARQNKNYCETCGSSFFSVEDLEEHKKEHNIEEYTLCSICLSEFPSDEAFHAATHKCLAQKGGGVERSTPLSWKAPPPRQLTEAETKILSGLQPDNPSEKVLLQSLKEKEKFDKPKASTEGEGRKSPLQPEATVVHANRCKFCPKSFRKPSDLTRHLRTHTGEKPYKCLKCYKRFAIKSALVCHMKTHTKDKAFECYVCSKLFATSGSLKIHMRLHTGLRPFACELCSETFRTSGHKKAHLLKHLKPSRRRQSQAATSASTKPSSSDKPVLLEISGVDPTNERLPYLEPNGRSQVSSYLSHSEAGLLTTSETEEPNQLVPVGDLMDLGDFLTQKSVPGSLPEEISRSPGESDRSGNKNPRYLLNIKDEGGGGNGDAPRYLLSIKESSSGEDGFLVESVSDDQIVVTITKGEANPPSLAQSDSGSLPIQSSAVESYPCSHCKKTFYKGSSLERHILKFHPKELFPCSMCGLSFERGTELELHRLEHELAREETCPGCGETGTLCDGHKCLKSPSLDLSLDQDLFLFS